MSDITIVFPSLNEKARLKDTLKSYADYFGDRADLVVVDNGSTDGTTEFIQQTYANHPRISILSYDHALGKGGAVYAGFKDRDTPWLGFVDPDGSTSASEFDRLINEGSAAEVVIASRWIAGAHIDRPQPLLRMVYGRMFNVLVNVLFRFRLKDTQCGAKIIKQSVYEEIRPTLTINGFAFDVELILRVKQHGFFIREVPIHWHDVKGSTLSERSGLQAAIDVLSLWWHEFSRRISR